MTITAIATPDEPERATTPPRDNLFRSVPFTFVRDTDNGDGLTFQGYGAVFNSPTRIDSWEGCFDEQIAPGAFRKSLKERTPKFQFDHGRHPLIGSVPIGAIADIHEDERGLFVQARLGKHMLIDLIREAISTGAIDGMSFRFSVVNDEWRDRDGNLVKPDDVDTILYGGAPERAPLLRTLKEVKIVEVGPVVWPAYGNTTAAVRSEDEQIILYRNRLHEPEQQRLLAEAVLRAEAATPEEESEGDSSDDEPQDTTSVAVEHSDQDTDAPRSTSEAGEHASASNSDETPAPTDEVDARRYTAFEQVFTTALDEVRATRESTPPMKGL